MTTGPTFRTAGPWRRSSLNSAASSSRSRWSGRMADLRRSGRMADLRGESTYQKVTYIYMYIYIYGYCCANWYVCLNTYIYIYMYHMDICLLIYTHIHIYIYTYIRIHVLLSCVVRRSHVGPGESSKPQACSGLLGTAALGEAYACCPY